MALFTLHMGYWRHGRNPFTDEGEHMRVTIYRISQVPTVQVYMNNLSVWSPGYNGSEVSPQVERDIGGNEHWLHDNTLPVDFCWLTASFFLVSALFSTCGRSSWASLSARGTSIGASWTIALPTGAGRRYGLF